MSVDGLRLKQSWNAALNDAQTQLQSLLTSATSPLWRRVPPVVLEGTHDGSQTASEEAQVIIHKRPSKQGEIFRLVHDIPADDFSIGFWKAVLATPEIRQEWDPAVESAQLLEIFDVDVRIAKTYFTLGWPANPRDAITISRTLTDGATLLDVTTSLPRSPDEPPYLRPTPPYVRSHVHLFAWVVQQVPTTTGSMVRLTCFWQHDLKAVWGMGMPSRAQHLCSMMVGIVRVVNKFGCRIPVLQGFGLGVGMERMAFDVGRKALTVEYSIVHEQEGENNQRMSQDGTDDLRVRKERKRLERSVEFILPSQSSWDVQMVTRASSQGAATPWTVNVYRDREETPDREQLLLRTRHAPPPSIQALVKVKLVIEAAAGTAGLLRLNGHPHPIEELENRDLASISIPEQLLQDASNVGALSFQTSVTGGSFADDASRTASTRAPGGRTEGSQKSISKLVRRNYVYFASLLQEPEVKWKPLVEARGVAVTQLDSIDPTLVVYRAEAVFVGVTVWDLISVISTPGATVYWDKNFDGANLIEDVSELSQLWHFKTKAAWPVNARESVLLRSTYKSPTSVHIFSFSTDDPQLFPGIPQSDPSIIRTQVDLRGWAIEALSPTTTQVTLIEQSDPKGWSNKSSLPQQIIAAVSGVGEFAIKCGGPPTLIRLGGARALVNRYDHEKGVFRLEYEVDDARRASVQLNNSTPSGSIADLSETIVSATTPTRSFTECELRCDMEMWGGPIDIVIDPPPQSASCLRRHRLSDNGGGLWLTIEHDADFVMGEQLRVVVRKGALSTAKDKGAVLINGAKAKVEVEELPEAEAKLLAKRKRVKPIRIPLDQPPVVSAIQRRRAEWAVDSEASPSVEEKPILGSLGQKAAASTLLGNPISRFMTMAVTQATSSTTSAMSAVTKPFALTEQTVPTSNKEPMQHALDALAYLRALYARPSQDGWIQVADNAGLIVLKKLETEVSRTIPVHKATKVIEGVTAEEMMNIISSHDCRKQWDDRFDSAVILQDFGHGCQTAFTVVKGAFPFQPRGFYTATLLARSSNPQKFSAETGQGSGLLTPQTDAGTNPIHYHATASFNPDSVTVFAASKYNPSNYAVGRVLLRGWICETLDPYTAENYAIPSTRCTFVSAVDFAGAVPVAYNSVLNASLPRAILRLENYLKTNVTIPFSYIPSIGVAVEPEEGPQEGWSFKRKDDGQLLVGRRYLADQRQLRARVLIDLPLEEKETKRDDITPTPSKFLNSPFPITSTRSDSSPRPHHPSLSLPGGLPPDIPRSWSPERDSIRQSTSNRFNSLGPTSTNNNRKPLPSFSAPTKDCVIADLIVDSKQYPEGFAVETFSQLRTPEESINLSPQLKELQHVLPIITTIFSIPANLFRSSHSEKSGNRYLVRLSLQTAAPTIDDPLIGQVAPPKPPWLLDLMEKGGLVDVVIKPLPEGSSVTTNTPTNATANITTTPIVPYKVAVDGVAVGIVNEQRSISILGKAETEPASRMPWVARSDNATFPKELSIPSAIAKDCLRDIKLEREEVAGGNADNNASQPVATTGTRDGDAAQAIPNSDGPKAGLGTFFTSYSWWGKRTPTPLATGTEQVVKVEENQVGGEKPSVTEPPKEPARVVTTIAQQRLQLGISLSAALILAFICFLLGSLVRSLLSPADFVIVKNAVDLTDLDEHGNWRRLTRLIELKYVLRGNDLIIGIVHA